MSRNKRYDDTTSSYTTSAYPYYSSSFSTSSYTSTAEEEDDEEPMPKVLYPQLFRYATKLEICATIIGLLISSTSGCIFPVSMIYYGEVVNKFVSPETELLDAVRQQVIIFSILGAIGIVLGFLQAYLLSWVADRQIDRIRLLFFRAVLRQDTAWHERHPVGSVITQISNNMAQIEEGMGGNLSNFFRDMSLFFAGIIVALVQGWKLTLVAIAMIPLIAVVFTCLALVIQLYVKVEIQAYSTASSLAAEILSSIRTVFAFGGEKNAAERYDRELGTAQKAGIKKGILLGASIGMISVTIFSTVAVLFYYGTVLIKDKNEKYEPGVVVLIIMNLVYGAIAVGKAMPLMEFFLKAAGNARPIFATIEREPPISIDAAGITLKKFKGNIEFKNVDFNYPQRPDVQILTNFNLKIKAGETIALVGPSGSGKSTIFQLIMRMYDAVHGSVFIDNKDVREINLPWLRKQIGIVSQEPTLFSGSVENNIKIGLAGVSHSDIVNAAKMANAHNFIANMPMGYETWLGEGGASISGGQKQRIAIARALVRGPKMLLLDEATSALDTHSERLVQSAVEKVRKGRTVIMIAHRLTTVRKADRIIVMDRGKVKEMGNHEELMRLNGLYAKMVNTSEKKESGPESESSSDESANEKTAKVKNRKEKSKKTLRGKGFEEEEEVEVKLKQSSTLRTLRWNRPEAFLMFVGFLGAAISGAVEPSFALLFAETFEIFIRLMFGDDPIHKIRLITGLMSMVGFIKFFAQLAQYWLLAIAGERLTRRVRKALFEAMLRQEPGWFDKPENQCGILTARLANEAPQLRKVSGERGGVIVESITITVITIVLSFYYSWQLALVNMAFLPALVFVGALQVRDMGGDVGSVQVAGTEVVQESLSAQRTVTTLGLEDYFYDMFYSRVTGNHRAKMSKRCSYSIVNAFAQGIQFFQNAAIYYLGALLIEKGHIERVDMFRSISVANFGAQGLGRAASFLPDLNSAMTGAKAIYKTLDRQTKLDVYAGKIPSKPFKGRIEFDDVYFSYPTRKTLPVLKGFSEKIKKGSNVAFVGESGCGKSTCLQLVQRMYDANNMIGDGGIMIDGMNIKEIQTAWLRNHIGVVQQEPSLYNMTIKENIAYGDLNRDIPMKEIIEAAKEANIHNFIQSLPLGYDTNIGFKGSLLSGGQKQRIAIARALIRKPVVLLLDEATSALDVESERVVQAALEKAMDESDRTCLVVAHRLSALSQCNRLVVLYQGVNVESGTIEELMAKKGHYYSLHNESVETK